MVRRLAVVWAVVITLGFGVPAGGSNAAPDDGGQCSFVLTPPSVVQISGVSFVTAAMKPGSCTLHAVPNSSVVCLSIEGDDSAGQCATMSGQNAAVIYYTYRPGATYVVKGQGCANTFAPPYTLCQDFSPSRVTL